MTTLFEPLKLRKTVLPNRVMVSPMCQYSCNNQDGMPTDWHLVHLGNRAVGGAGIVMTEAAAVEPRGRITPEDLGIWNDNHCEALTSIATFIESQGSVPAIQLAHAGRKASKSRPWEGSKPLQPKNKGWETIAPSSIPWPYEKSETTTTRMNQKDIKTVVESFRAAADRAHEAGFEITEIHAAHGYLLHEFLSPVTNHRTDDYGGDFENRTRLIREVTAAIREVWPDEKPIFVRISATDWLPETDSWTIEQSIRLADNLSEIGVDLIDVSAGGIAPDQQIPHTGAGYQIPYAERLTHQCDSTIAVGAVGGITSPEQADELARNGRADLAIIGREHLRNPYFSLHAARKLGQSEKVECPAQYHRGFE